MSYYDTWVGNEENAVLCVPIPQTTTARIYQYDPLGWVTSLGYHATTAWGANVFTAIGYEQLRAVSFYTPAVNSTYQIYVYTNATSGPTSGTLASSTAGTTTLPGYFTIALPAPVNLTPNLMFSVVVEFTTPGYTYSVPIEYALSGYSSAATASPGKAISAPMAVHGGCDGLGFHLQRQHQGVRVSVVAVHYHAHAFRQQHIAHVDDLRRHDQRGAGDLWRRPGVVTPTTSTTSIRRSSRPAPV